MKIFRISLGLLIISLVLNGCTEKFEELNTQPDALLASKMDVSLLGQAFANAQGRTLYGAPGGSTAGFQTAQSLFADLYSQYFATTATNFDSDRHTQVGNWSNGAWTYFYQQAAPVIKLVEDYTEQNNMPVENAIIKIWKVEAYHRITDYWGPIIYSEFGNGKTSVAYDPQEAVYRDFFVKLDEAVAVLKANPGATVFVGHDQLYSGTGNADKWLRFANSLRLRLAMRVKYADYDLAKAQAEKAIADGVIETNDQNALLLTTPTSRNPYWIITDWGEFRMSAVMESVLTGFDDPRTEIYFSPTQNYVTTGTGKPYRGLRNGLPKVQLNQGALNLAHSDMGKLFLNQGRGGSASGPSLRVLSS
ncbi:MAG: SusD/RagB family nutrient-binding outer membrane lipoprotein, partial [Chryseosolibacter sp.]